MKELELCSHEQAKRLKELGFDWNSQLTVALALKYMRDVKGICTGITCKGIHCKWYEASYIHNNWHEHIQCLFNTYEAAEIGLLDELLTLIDNPNN